MPLYMFLNNFLYVLVQIANKTGLFKNLIFLNVIKGIFQSKAEIQIL
jgi:hypothetical protein